MRRLAIAAVLCLWLAGCGGDDEPAERTTAAPTTATPSATQTAPPAAGTPPSTTGTTPGGGPAQGAVDAVRECLADQGYRATGGVRPSGTPNAPQYEILVAGARGSAFIAFHRNLARARRYEAQVRRNARRFDAAAVERQGTITTVWVELNDPAARERIRDCVREVS